MTTRITPIKVDTPVKLRKNKSAPSKIIQNICVGLRPKTNEGKATKYRVSEPIAGIRAETSFKKRESFIKRLPFSDLCKNFSVKNQFYFPCEKYSEEELLDIKVIPEKHVKKPEAKPATQNQKSLAKLLDIVKHSERRFEIPDTIKQLLQDQLVTQKASKNLIENKKISIETFNRRIAPKSPSKVSPKKQTNRTQTAQPSSRNREDVNIKPQNSAYPKSAGSESANRRNHRREMNELDKIISDCMSFEQKSTSTVHNVDRKRGAMCKLFDYAQERSQLMTESKYFTIENNF